MGVQPKWFRVKLKKNPIKRGDRTAEWKLSGFRRGLIVYKCSNCGYETEKMYKYSLKKKRCPSCGAKMENWKSR